MPEPLPIDAHLPALIEAVRARRGAVVVAEPGAGKTTRVPPALLDALPGEVWVLEPRRLAARLAAERVAAERGQRLGEEVGYQVRFEQRAGPRTRLRFLTEGVLTRRLARGGEALAGVAAVVLDELHERHVDTDLALALLEAARRERELALVVMSATLDAAPVAALLDAPVLEVAGRLHPVEIEHEAGRDDRPLEDKVAAAVARLVDEGLRGHVLVFLPGMGEIRRAERTLGPLARAADLRLLPLHGALGRQASEAALAPSRARKVILATNVAESSLTIDGVEAVVDSGLAREAEVSPRSGLLELVLRPISRASATQRAHRAGRQGPGRCLRLYTRNDHDRRPAAAVPELLRQELSGVLLAVRAAGFADPRALRWLDPPGEPAWSAADALLGALGACDAAGALTPTGRALLRYPLPPRLARVVDEGHRRGVGPEAAAAAALLGERPIRALEARDAPPAQEARSDVLVLLDLLAEANRAGFRPGPLRTLGLDPQAARSVDRAREQVARRLPREGAGPAPTSSTELERGLSIALLAGHPDRVARRLPGGGYTLAGGGGVRLAPSSAVRGAEWLVVLDAGGSRGGAPPTARLVSAIEPDWLLELFPDALEETHAVEWDPRRERVEARWRLSYGGLAVEESSEPGDPEQVAAVLARAAREAGPAAFVDAGALEALRRRLAFARELDPALPDLDEAGLEAALSALCEGRRSFAELRQADLFAHLEAALGYDALRRVDRLAPTHVTLPGGRRCEVHYELRQPPWIASRLQDFFGLSAGPTVGGGRVPLTLHLLAPNRQAVSVTSDLAGFWERHYPTERRHLSRRYPRHSWPEDPRTAQPPRPGRTR